MFVLRMGARHQQSFDQVAAGQAGHDQVEEQAKASQAQRFIPASD
jgi:hypothetical protein